MTAGDLVAVITDDVFTQPIALANGTTSIEIQTIGGVPFPPFVSVQGTMGGFEVVSMSLKRIQSGNAVIDNTLTVEGPGVFGTAVFSGRVGAGTPSPAARLQSHDNVVYSFPEPGQTPGTLHLSAEDPNQVTQAVTFGGPGGYTNQTQAGIYSSVAFGVGSTLHVATTDDFNAGAKVRMTLDQFGNAGIGTTTPAARLQPHNTVAYSFPTPGQSVGTVHLSATDANVVTNAITFGGPAGYVNLTEAGIYSEVEFGTGSKLHIATTDDFNAGAKIQLTIDQDGNLGISTRNPRSRLDLADGAITLREMTPPATPNANRCVIYADDNAGRTRLMVKFANGTTRVIAAD